MSWNEILRIYLYSNATLYSFCCVNMNIEWKEWNWVFTIYGVHIWRGSGIFLCLAQVCMWNDFPRGPWQIPHPPSGISNTHWRNFTFKRYENKYFNQNSLWLWHFTFFTNCMLSKNSYTHTHTHLIFTWFPFHKIITVSVTYYIS